MSKIAIIGAGLSGAVVARRLASAGHRVDVFESRPHVAGNCHTERDAATGVMVHKYGAHIFHTDNETVWDYVRQFDTFEPFKLRPRANVDGRIYGLPINLQTLNQFFETAFTPSQARSYVADLTDTSIETPANFEEQALKLMGRELYEAFFKGYTIKQWGRDPKVLPASILKRLPFRFNYNDAYFDHPFQAIPRHGYTDIVRGILDIRGVTVNVSAPFDPYHVETYDHIFNSGKLDAWYGYRFGPLAYRTIDFKTETHMNCDFQGCEAMNYCDESVPFTRIIEHKHFTPWENNPHTVIHREFSREATLKDEPFYPVRLTDDKAALAQYEALADKDTHVTHIGRLGRYQYIDMHQAIGQALELEFDF